MNYKQITEEICKVAGQILNVNSTTVGDIYTTLAEPNIRFSNINISLENVDKEGSNLTYNMILYYSDRVIQDDKNIVEIQTDAIQKLSALIDALDYLQAQEISTITPFQQQFTDYLAGAYATITITTAQDVCDI